MPVPRIEGRQANDRRVGLLFDRIGASFERNNRAWSKVVAPSFRDVLKPLRTQIRRNTPKASGQLRRSVTTAADSRAREVMVGYRYQRGQDPRYMQQVAVEFGLEKTRRYRASAPIRTAWRKSGVDHDKVADAMEGRLDRFLVQQRVPGLRIER